MPGGSETDNERRTFVRRRHLVRSNKFSRKRSGQKYIKQMLNAQCKGVQFERPGAGESGTSGLEICLLDEKATRRSMRHLRHAQYLYPGYLRKRDIDIQRYPSAQCEKTEGRKWLDPEIVVHGWKPEGTLSRPWSSFQTPYLADNGSDADDEMFENEKKVVPETFGNPFLVHWRWYDAHQRHVNLQIICGRMCTPESEKWYEMLDEADYLVQFKPGKTKR